ncbi:hypothetical protein NMY22_g12539 [Coprinellus aureogranulatus]|nr:hypothetical protein NMY22_g12539 [Coprinellus aureogranulatus]
MYIGNTKANRFDPLTHLLRGLQQWGVSLNLSNHSNGLFPSIPAPEGLASPHKANSPFPNLILQGDVDLVEARRFAWIGKIRLFISTPCHTGTPSRLASDFPDIDARIETSSARFRAEGPAPTPSSPNSACPYLIAFSSLALQLGHQGRKTVLPLPSVGALGKFPGLYAFV